MSASVGINGSSGGGADPYEGKWVTLSNTTLGMLMVVINQSIVLISLPDIFRGIHLNPLTPGNSSYFLWLLMGFSVVTSVLVVSFGRVGDMFGRVRMYNAGFAVFTVFSILLAVTWLHGSAGALWLIAMRIGQGVGGAMLFANSSAILTDAFPENQRGLALGVNQVAAIGGSFIGLVLGGVLGPVGWRYVFLVSVPFGVFGTIWAYYKLVERGIRTPSKIDWWGNLTFAVGLVALLVGITYGIEPYGSNSMGWTNPRVIGAMAGGIIVLGIFGFIETKVANPMFRLPLFRIRAFAAGNFASLLAALGRGGMMFILIIWLQGIWLPQHGYSFSNTPLWAGIFMLPLTVGFLVAGPVSGILSDHYGARPFATGGMVAAAVSFGLLELLPANFSYVWFGLLLLLNGLAMGLFSSPNRAGIMNSLPPNQRGAGSGMTATFQNSAMVLSIGIFFTLIIAGLSGGLPGSLYHGLVAHGVPANAAARISHLPPTGALFAAFLGYNPMDQLLGPVLGHVSHAQAAYLTGRSFFPRLVSPPFMTGLRQAFDFAVAACAIAAVASWLRGGKYHYVEGAELAGFSNATGADYSSAQSVLSAHDGETVPPPAAVGMSSSNGSKAMGEEPVPTVRSQGSGEAIEHFDVTTPGLGGITGSSLSVAAAQTRGTVAPARSDRDAGYTQEGLGHRGALRGVARAHGGDPICGAVVTVLDARGAQRARVSTGHDGQFSVEWIGSGTCTVLVTASGYRPTATTIAVNGAVVVSDFVLTGIGAVSGVVRQFSSGAALPGATVALTGAGGEVVARTVTGADGAYRFEDLAEGEYSVVARAPRHHLASVPVTVRHGPSAAADFFLRGTIVLSGVVRQAFSAAALSGATVTLTDAGGEVVARTVTGADGAYRFEGLAEGDYTLVSSGFYPTVAPLTLSLASGDHALDLELGQVPE